MESSKGFGAALFALALENKKENEYADELKVVRELLDENPQYIEILSSPSISMSERLAAIDEAFGSHMSEYVVSFIKILCQKGKIKIIDSCIEEYMELVKAAQNISIANVISAVEMNEDEKDRIAKKLEGMTDKTVVMNYTLDESIIGGLVINMDGHVIDGSIRQRLNEIKEVMAK